MSRELNAALSQTRFSKVYQVVFQMLPDSLQKSLHSKLTWLLSLELHSGICCECDAVLSQSQFAKVYQFPKVCQVISPGHWHTCGPDADKVQVDLYNFHLDAANRIDCMQCLHLFLMFAGPSAFMAMHWSQTCVTVLWTLPTGLTVCNAFISS